MNNIKLTVYFIGVGLTLGFTLIVYAHGTFTTKEISQIILDRLDRIEAKIDKLK